MLLWPNQIYSCDKDGEEVTWFSRMMRLCSCFHKTRMFEGFEKRIISNRPYIQFCIRVLVFILSFSPTVEIHLRRDRSSLIIETWKLQEDENEKKTWPNRERCFPALKFRLEISARWLSDRQLKPYIPVAKKDSSSWALYQRPFFVNFSGKSLSRLFFFGNKRSNIGRSRFVTD